MESIREHQWDLGRLRRALHGPDRGFSDTGKFDHGYVSVTQMHK